MVETAAAQPGMHIIDLLRRGRLLAAREFAVTHHPLALPDLDCVVSVITTATWLRLQGPNEMIRTEAHGVVQAVSKIAEQWVAQTPPRPLPAEKTPHDKAAFDTLMIELIGHGGFYHPIEVPSAEGYLEPSRNNARVRDDLYHPSEWELVEGLLTRHLGGIDGRFIVDAGTAEGFFSRMLARRGAEVLAVDQTIMMAVRTAVLSALNGLQDRITTSLGNVAALATGLGAMRRAGTIGRVDAICALGLIYHFHDLEHELTGLLCEEVPVVFEFTAADPRDEAGYDPSRHRDGTPISLPWLVDWLARRGYVALHEPRWAEYVARRSTSGMRQEMLMALPRAQWCVTPTAAHFRG